MPVMQDVAFGWPALSMWYAGNAERDWQSGALISRERLGSVEEVSLPLWLIWPGFAINTMFYAAILAGGWLLFAAPLALRRRRRIKRGLCPACAYPIGSSDNCTECGKPVKKHLSIT